MTKEQRLVFATVHRLSERVLFFKDRFIALGRDDYSDLLVTGRLKSSIDKPLYFVEQKQQKISQNECAALYERALALLDQGSVGSLTLTKIAKERINAAIDKLSATHMRIYSNQNGIHLVLFDMRRFEPEYRIGRKNEVLAVTDMLTSHTAYKFSTTLLARTFRKSPPSDYQVIVSPNGITQFRDAQQRAYVFRDQDIKEPLNTFVSEPLGKDISFWLHPKTTLPNPDTSLI